MARQPDDCEPGQSGPVLPWTLATASVMVNLISRPVKQLLPEGRHDRVDAVARRSPGAR